MTSASIPSQASVDETPYPIPSAREQQDFLIRLYFGPGSDYLRLCVRRAYLDLNRTLHGFSAFVGARMLRDSAHAEVESQISQLRAACPAINRAGFDDWHQQAVGALRQLYRDQGFGAENSRSGFTVGQAQKWLNMALKYVFAIGEERLPGYGAVYSYAHVPIDNIILSALKPKGAPSPRVAWSRLDDYSEYMEFQQWCRESFPRSAPLAVEFRLWLDSEQRADVA